MKKITEQLPEHRNLEEKSFAELLKIINDEDKKVPWAIEKALPQIEALVKKVYEQMARGGRLFYIGSGTSGRLGIVDASECPPTFGVPHSLVIGIIAGGDSAIRKAVEFAEDDEEQGWKDLQAHNISPKDFVVGLSASGTTPYTVGALKFARKNGIPTGCITCNLETPLAKYSDFPVEVIVGPEVIAGSTRMKAGTAQKLVLNMITTSVMIKLGHIWDNKMIDLQLTNKKLIDRATRYLSEYAKIPYEKARKILLQQGSLRKSIKYIRNQNKENYV